MNAYLERLLDKPSIESGCCVFCGRPATNRHHVVRRSQGGSDGPTVPVCGNGNLNGCHGLLHALRLHLDWRDGCWQYLRTDEPTKYEKALAMPGWRKVRTWDDHRA